ncbi:MAG TPA: flagellar hook protein FlgE [Acidobacteriaceae bacterium]|jgi:flagellar hook protein FlgE|nr:flagellar hook protein FlgE [Acidobacteriaceae bacterium]
MSSFSIPLTGLEASSTALNTIANNLSNMNTTAFKSQSVNFCDLFYQEIGSNGAGDPLQVGAGTQIGSTQTDFTQGSIAETGNAANVALNGSGFFVVENGGQINYTRDGNFTQSADGSLVTQDGQKLMGYPVINGVVDTNAPLTAIQIPVGQVEQPQATSTMSLTANLDAGAATGAVVPAQITVYDSLGVAHVATINFTNNGGGSWGYAVSLPAGDSTGGTNLTGTLQFDANGNLTAPAANVGGIQFTGLSDGASPLNITWNLYGANNKPTITQVASESAVSGSLQNGYTSGEYNGFTIGSDGLVSATFYNGQTTPVGQLALASITNQQGLTITAGNNYQTTLASGAASYGVAGSAGLGSMQDEALEQSNVDISTEFSDLIVAQQAFEASSKAITTFDTVSQETINMIH